MTLNITFGILSSEINRCDNLNRTIQSILLQNIPMNNYEIIVIHSYPIDITYKNNNIKYIRYNNGKTKKKVIIMEKRKKIIELSNKEYILVLKDYHILYEKWYDNFTNDKIAGYDLFLNEIILQNGERYLDFCIGNLCNYMKLNITDYRSKGVLLPYIFSDNPKIVKLLDCYVSGATFICKRDILQKLKYNYSKKKKNKDTYYCRRLFKLVGYKIKYCSGCKITCMKTNISKKYYNRSKLVDDNIIRCIENKCIENKNITLL